MVNRPRTGWGVVRDLRLMPLIYIVPIALALVFPAVVAFDGGGVFSLALWWPLAALGALTLADKSRGVRVILIVLMSFVCSLLAIVWLGGQLMLPALFVLLVIEVFRATLQAWRRRVRSASPSPS